MAEKCNYLANAVDAALDKYEAVVFKAGQKAAGMTKKEAERILAEDKEEMDAAINAITGKVDALIACEIRESGGNLAPDEEAETETERPIVFVTSDCAGCEELLPKLEGKDVEVIDAASDEGVAFLEDTMDQGIQFEMVPAVFLRHDGKFELLSHERAEEVLGLKAPP